jgi:hypothetical protein
MGWCVKRFARADGAHEFEPSRVSSSRRRRLIMDVSTFCLTDSDRLELLSQVDNIDGGGVNPGFANAVATPLPMGPASSNSVATPVATPAWP